MKLEITKISDLDVEEITKNALEEFIKRLKKFAGDNFPQKLFAQRSPH